MTRDDALGMAWWNALREQERAQWSAIAGNTGRSKDAWEAFKRGTADQTPPIDSTRRCFLTIAAGGAVAAAIPTAAVAGIPTAIDPAFSLIAEKRAADVAHCEAIDAQDEAEKRFGYDSDESFDAAERSTAACHAANEIDWKLANTPPTTIAGVAAVLRFANQIEDEGGEWPDTDTIGREGWHYQLRATMAEAVEALLKAQAGKAVQA